jgi:integrase
MAYIIKIGCLRVKVTNLNRRISGLYYFRRGIPEDLREFYDDRSEVNQSLRTHDEKTAIAACQALTAFYTDEFKLLRSPVSERKEAIRLLKSNGLKPIPLANDYTAEQLNNDGHPYNILRDHLRDKHDITDGAYSDLYPHERRALDILHGEEKVTLEEICANAKEGVVDKKRLQEIDRCFKYFIKELPITYLHVVKRRQIQEIVNKLLKSFSTGTVKKALGLVRKEVQETIVIHELAYANPFTSVKIKGLGGDVKERDVFTSEELSGVKELVLDKIKLPTAKLIGLLINTGARCAEVGGIQLRHIKLNDERPHLVFEETDNRRLKTKASKRLVPLVGISLEVAKQIKREAVNGQVYAFPQWNREDVYNNNGCSNAVNKLMKKQFPSFTTHCFRHTITDRLKEASVPLDIIKTLCGWSGGGMVNHYGKTKMLGVLSENMGMLMKFEGYKY